MKELSLDLMYHKQADGAQASADNARQLRQMKQLLVLVMQKELTPRQREILDLYYYEGLNTVEIADRLGVNKSTVSRTKQRGLSTIRRFLQYYPFR